MWRGRSEGVGWGDGEAEGGLCTKGLDRIGALLEVCGGVVGFWERYGLFGVERKGSY